MGIIIGNILCFSGGLLDFLFSLKFNEKSKILLCNCLTSSLSFIAYIFLGAYDGLIGCIITILRLITIYFKDKYKKKCIFLFVVFFGLYFLVFLKNSGAQTIVLFLGLMCSFIPKWFSKDMQKIRCGALFATILSMAYNVMIHNYASIPIQVINVVLILISITKWAIELRSQKEKTTTQKYVIMTDKN